MSQLMCSPKCQTTYLVRSMKYLLEPLRGWQIRMTADKTRGRPWVVTKVKPPASVPSLAKACGLSALSDLSNPLWRTTNGNLKMCALERGSSKHTLLANDRTGRVLGLSLRRQKLSFASYQLKSPEPWHYPHSDPVLILYVSGAAFKTLNSLPHQWKFLVLPRWMIPVPTMEGVYS